MKTTYHSYTKSALAVAAALMLVLQGCTLDTPEDSVQVPALQLQVEQDLSLTNLSWTRVNVTGFQEYVILQSHQDIPNTPEPETGLNVAIAARFDDISVTSFSSINTLFTPQTCYKLYTKVNDRFLYSPTVCVDNHSNVIPGFYDRVGYNKADNNLVMFDRINANLALYDLDNETLVTTVFENQLSFPVLQVSQHNGVNFVYAFDQNQQRIRKYRLPELSLVHSHQVSNGIIGGVVDGPFLYLGTQNAQTSFQVLDNETFTQKDSRDGFTGQRNYAVFPGDTTTVLEIWDSRMRQYRINQQGKVIAQAEFVLGLLQLSLQNTCDANDAYYIGGRFSRILDKDANTVTSLVEDINSVSIYSRFSPDGSKAIILGQNQQQFFLEIHDITALPSATLLKQYVLPSANYADVFMHDGIIHVVGIDFSSSNTQTFILKIPLAS
jgi:hypothetical protein